MQCSIETKTTKQKGKFVSEENVTHLTLTLCFLKGGN